MELILEDSVPRQTDIKLQGKKIKEFFTEDYSSEQIEEIIFGLLRKWKSEQRTEI